MNTIHLYIDKTRTSKGAKFTVQRATNESFTENLVTIAPQTQDTDIVDAAPDKEEDVTYYYRCRAITDNNESEWSEPVSFFVEGTSGSQDPNPPIDTTPPAEVTDVSVDAKEDEFDITWINPSDSDLSHIDIFIDGVKRATVSAPDSSVTVSGSFTAGDSYDVRIVTVDNSGNESSGWSRTITVPDNEPGDPSQGDGTEANPYLIYTVEDLVNISNDLNAHYKLMNDLDLGVPPFNLGSGWVPINNFGGLLDGNNKTIKNLFINKLLVSPSHYVGLFGNCDTSPGIVKNLTLENINVQGTDYIGGLVGCGLREIANVHVYGSVSGGVYVGGIVGKSSAKVGTKIKRCVSYADVNYISEADNPSSHFFIGAFGGVVGGTDRTLSAPGHTITRTTIEECVSKSNVKGRNYTGGITGELFRADLRRCVSLGELSAETGSVGGIAGEMNTSTVENSYSLSKITKGGHVGGISASSSGTVSVKSCYSAGSMKDAIANGAGRIYGIAESNGSPIENCYWDIEKTGVTSSAEGQGLTTEQMKYKVSYPGFDWTNIWALDDGESEPYLQALGKLRSSDPGESEDPPIEDKEDVVIDIDEGSVFHATANHLVLIGEDGKVYTMGNNADGQLGNGVMTDSEDTLVEAAFMENARKVMAASTATYVLNENNELYLIGSREYSGTSETDGNATMAILIKDNVADFKVDGDHAGVLIDTSGDIWVWGNNQGSRLGEQDSIKGLPNGSRVPARGHIEFKKLPHTANSVKNAWVFPTIVTFADSDKNMLMSGALGGGYSRTHEFVKKPLDNGSGDLRNIVKMSSYGVASVYTSHAPYSNHYRAWAASLAIDDEGVLYGWGMNNFGFGDGITIDRENPIVVPYINGQARDCLVTNRRTFFVIRKNDELWAWGDNGYATVGNGTRADTTVPTKILDNVFKVTYSGNMVFALTKDGKVYAWGRGNSWGFDSKDITRVGSTDYIMAPALLPGLKDKTIIDFCANENGIVALTKEKAVLSAGWSWRSTSERYVFKPLSNPVPLKSID